MSVYRFEGFSLDTDRVELRRGSELVHVEPQVFDLLNYLIQNHDRTVGKDDLIAAVWRGRIVSESTLTSRITAVRRAIGDAGARQRLIRTVHRKGYRFVGTVHAGFPPDEETAIAGGARPIRNRPAIAILPFENLSADRALQYFIDGVADDMTTALSRFPWLAVVARSSTLAYRRRPIDVRAVGLNLGVRYVVEGSVRKAGERIRITARLIEADTGLHVWAKVFDQGRGDTLELQKRATASIVAAIGQRLEQGEIERVKCKPIASLDAYEFYLRGMNNAYQWTEEGMREALHLFQNAIDADADFAPPYGMAAYCYVQRKSYGWFTNRAEEITACARLVQQAIEVGKEDAVALSRAAHAVAYVVGDVENGTRLVEQACRIAPDLPLARYVSGWLRVFRGQPGVAIAHLTTALRLNPTDPLAFKMHAALAYALLFSKRYDEASVSAERALRARPNYLTGLRGAAASHACAGRLGEANRLMSRARELGCALRISKLDQLIPLRRPGDMDLWAEGLRKAGLPS